MSDEKPNMINLCHAQPGDTVYYVGYSCIEKIEVFGFTASGIEVKSSWDRNVLQHFYPRYVGLRVFTNYWDAHKELTKKKLDRQK